MKIAAILLASLWLALGCTEPKPATVAGSWTGSTGSQTLTLGLTEVNGAVTGTGTLTNTPSGTKTYTVTGTFSSPTFTATLNPGGGATPFTLTANVNGDTMTGTLNGAGFTGQAITLTR